ncbi:hypothetical protein ACO1O0_004137 [Amphichorda felina]
MGSPYAPAVLRFHIRFPDSYPNLPPMVTFSTDIFHPLITPLTTYMYTTDIQDNGTVSATDDERLPPGGFSLRHGFPEWFGRGKRAAQGSRQTSGQQGKAAATPKLTGQARVITPESGTAVMASYAKIGSIHISAYDVLNYIRGAFDSDDVLDSVPLDAAGNPGAWHAWRTRRRKLGKLQDDKLAPAKGQSQEQDDRDKAVDAVGISEKSASPQSSVRQPGEWNWDGVWEDRVKKGIASSLSESVLYGGSTTHPDELIQFLPLDESEIDSVKENIRRSLGSAT